MKKITFIILAIVLFLLLGGVIFYKIKIAKLPIENILPEGAIVYLRISDIEKRVDEFKTTRLWRNIKNIDVEMLMEKSGLSQEEIEQYRNFNSKFFTSIAELFLNKYFGREIAIALYPSKIDAIGPDTALDVASDFILVTRLKPGAEFLEFISKLFNKFGQKVQIVHEEYKDNKVTVVKLNDKLDIAYVKVRDLLVIGFGKKAAYACLDVFTKNTTSLSRDKDYVSTMSKLPKAAQTVAYGNTELFFSEIKQLLNKIFESQQVTAKQKAEILKPFDKLAGFKTAGFASIPGKISKDKTIWFFDKSKMDPFIADLYSLRPQKNNSINFVPKNIIGYQWSCFDPKSTWSYYKKILSEELKQVEQGPSFADIIAGFESEFGMSIEKDIIPALGNEIGGILSDINLGGPVPVLEVILFVKVNDKSALENVMNTLTKNNNLPMQSEVYRDIHIEYMTLPFGTNFQPAYCFLGDYFLFSTGRKPLKESIDTLAGQSDSLMANEDFKAINFGLTDKNNTVSFLKTDLLLHRIRGMCEWGFEWLSLLSKQLKASQERTELEVECFKKEIQMEESVLENLKANLRSVEKEIENLKSQELDTSLQQGELTRLESKIEEKQDEINISKKNLEEKEKRLTMINKSPMVEMDTSIVRLYLDKVVYPILEGLQTVKAVGSRTIFSENTLETESFSKIEE